MLTRCAGITLALVYISALLGCQSPAAPPAGPPLTGDSPAGPQPAFNVPLPDGATAQRDVSAAAEWSVLGRESHMTGGLVMPDFDSMVLSANPGALSFATYELFAGAFYFSVINFDISDVIVQDAVWIGVSDYDTGRWQWHQPAPGVTSIVVTGFEAKGSGGSTYLTVAVWDNGMAKVNRVWINVDVPLWEKHPVSLNGGMGILNGMALVDGMPGVIAQDQTAPDTYDLVYISAGAALPLHADWTATNLWTGYTGSAQALELIEAGGQVPGQAIIFDSGQLWYSYGGRAVPMGPSDWSWSYIDDAGNAELGLALMQNNPAVLYENLSIAGGLQVIYSRSNSPAPTDPDWESYVIAKTSEPTQYYAGLSLAAVQGELPAMQYYDDTSQEHYFAASTEPLPTIPAHLITSTVHNGPLGGYDSATADWQGRAALFFDSVNSTDPRYARPDNLTPVGPEEINNHHVLLQRGSQELTAAAIGSTLGVAWRDPSTDRILYAWYEGPGDPGPTSSLDWRIVEVDERQTEGEIGLCELSGGIPALCYHVTADDLLYFARMIPAT